jgi:hypothetical protein
MRRSNRELWLALLAIGVITLLYLLVMFVLQGIPAAGGLFGHAIGILGFVLMLMTETLYSLRKRSYNARWGRMAAWLKYHIITGLVGPYLVLLHTSWKFSGLAGIVVLLTVVIVASGFIGRYIYTAVPRTVDGVEVEADQLLRQVELATAELSRRLDAQPELAQALAGSLDSLPDTSSSPAGLFLGRFFSDWQFRRQVGQLRHSLPARVRPQVDQLEKLQLQRRVLYRQVASLALSRRMLALWHSVHMPIGMALFTAAFIHAGAALYYATFLK